MPQDPLDLLDLHLAATRPREASFDEQRAMVWVTRKLFGNDVAPPAQLGRYVVEDRLGSGGNGVVYRAHDPLLGRTVALKLLRRTAEGPHGTDGRAPLLAESRRIANVEHRNIARVFAVERDPATDAAFVVMEYLPGPTLARWVAEQGPEADVLADVFTAIARGLDAAHTRGIVHGDFKPENVLFDGEGQPRIVDFGGRGTPGYMSPERVAGGPATVASDVYAFGNAVAELWRDRPWTHPLTRAVRAALSPDPHARPLSAGAVARAMYASPRRRRILWVGAAVLVFAGLGAALVPRGVPTCPLPTLSLPDRLHDEARAAAARYLESWDEARAAACPVPPQASLACFEQLELQWTRVLPLVLDSPDTTRSAVVLANLSPASDCVELEESNASPQSPLREEFRALALEIHAAQNLGLWNDRGPELRARLAELRGRAQALGDASIEAEATLYTAIYALQTGAIDAAASDFEAAYLLATRAENPDTAFFAASNLTRIHSLHGERSAEAHRWLAAANDAAARRDDPLAPAEALQNAAELAFAERRLDDALALYDSSAAAMTDGARLDAWTELSCGRGNVLREMERTEEALQAYQAGLDRLDLQREQDTMMHACLLNGQGTTLTLMKRPAEALPVLERLLALLRREAPRSPDIAAALANVAQANADVGDHTQALVQFREVHDTFVALLGPRSPATTMARYGMAEQLFALDRDTEALLEAEAALRWSVPEPYASASTLLLARLAHRRGDVEHARTEVDTLLSREDLPHEVRTAALETLTQWDAR